MNNNLLLAEDITIYKPNLENIKQRGEHITPHDVVIIARLVKDRNKSIRDHSEMLHNQFCVAVALYYLSISLEYKNKFTKLDYVAMIGFGDQVLISQYLALAEYFKCDYEALKAFGLEHKTRSIRKLYAYTQHGVNSVKGQAAKYQMSFPRLYEGIIRDIKADRANLGNEKKAPREKHYHLYRLKRAILANFASYKPLDNLDFLNYCECFICKRPPTDHDKNVIMDANIGRHINLPVCKKCMPKRNVNIANNKEKLLGVVQLLVDYTKLLEEMIDASSGINNEAIRIISDKNYKLYDEKVFKPKKVKTAELRYKYSTDKI